ncbi:MAG: hypothetical protein ACLU9L_01645 [Christensenellales bacterium]
MMQEKTEQNWTQADSAPGASQDQAALGGDKGTDAAKEAAGPRGYGAHGGTHPRGREDGRAQNKGPEEEPLYSQAELQRELDRVAKKERERGRRQAQREQQAGTQPEGGADGTDQQTERENAQRATAPDGETGQEGGTAAAEQSTEADPADLLDAEQQRMLGRAMADKAIQEGDEAVQRGIERLLLKEEPLTAREDETLFWLFNHASLKACAEELTKRGVDGESIVKDKDFIAFAEMMRSDVPLLKVYEQYARTRGHKAKPASTGSVQGQGPAGAPYFSQEQVRHMTRKQVRAHYDEIEKSRRFWR